MLYTLLVLLYLLPFTTALTPCETGNDCPEGYSCFNDPAHTTLVCLSVSGNTTGAQVGFATSTGVTYDLCKTDDDCTASRTCRLIQTETVNVSDCDDREGCVCLSTTPVRCQSPDQCDEGEVCVETVTFGFICVSGNAVDAGSIDVVGQATGDDLLLDDVDGDDDDDDDDILQDDTHTTPDEPTSPANGTALVLDPCTTTSDCLSPRKCLDITGEPDIPCPADPQNACVCGYLDIPKCDTDSDCAEGETCSPRDEGHNFCVSKSALAENASDSTEDNNSGSGIEDLSGSAEPGDKKGGDEDEDGVGAASPEEQVEPSEEPLEEGVCIDAGLLSSHALEELVFTEHRLSRVLCDASGSCATKGHMVTWRGRAMMMKSYCGEVGCVEEVRKVNSPRYRRNGVVKTRSDGLVFMTTAARFGSRVEEALLAGLVAVGL